MFNGNLQIMIANCHAQIVHSVTSSYLQQIPQVYAEQLSPSSKGTDPLPIYLNVSILALPSIKTVDLQFTADYFINMRWYDHRLQFKDLNDKSILNGVNTLDLLKIWSPSLKFLNALGWSMISLQIFP